MINLDKPPLYETSYGRAYVADSLSFMAGLPDESINLIMTSPPYAIITEKEYGNVCQAEYIDWFLQFAREFKRILKPDGSLVVEIGGAWEKGRPTRSLYQFELLIALCRQLQFFLAQEFFWYNYAKPPMRSEWVAIKRVRVKDAVNCIWWLAKTPEPKANNLQVLNEYSEDMKRKLKYWGEMRSSSSGHSLSPPSGHANKGFYQDKGGAIPDNLIIDAHSISKSHYLSRCRELGIRPHPARYPEKVPDFFVRFLTAKGDLVLDPFAGSNTTGAVCEKLRRRWLAIEKEVRYLEASRFRFEPGQPENGRAGEPSLFDALGEEI